ncbi:MAG TPA: DnaJ domain-containing protein [Candidatus Limnocylindria bacterium]|nr:DnaJ domain-containing protein [Candidatus Limnocylindria bacterium]
MYQTLLPYSPERDVYRLLQVEPTADEAQIQAACRRLARRFHPDRNVSPRANQEMQVVNAVRALLTDPPSRAAYDRARQRFYQGQRVAAMPSPRTRPVERAPRPTTPPVVALPDLSAIPELAWPAAQTIGRQGRALLRGLRALIARLGPPRCPSCRSLVEAEYRYCADCGTGLLTG